jgi:hypothetical protein
MVERPLSMREASGSIPESSIFLSFNFLLNYSHNQKNKLSYRDKNSSLSFFSTPFRMLMLDERQLTIPG